MAIKALVFDVFGTLVDWRTSIAKESQRLLSPLGLTTDWHAFADDWRNEYQPAMEKDAAANAAFASWTNCTEAIWILCLSA